MGQGPLAKCSTGTIVYVIFMARIVFIFVFVNVYMYCNYN